MTDSQASSAVPPAVLQTVLGPPPLMRSESAADYDALTAQCAAAVEPQDMIEWMIVRDYVDLSWEILRLRRMKQHVVAVARCDAVAYIARAFAPQGGRRDAGELAATEWCKGGETRRALMDEFATVDVDVRTIESHAFLREANSVATIEGMIADKEQARRAVLRDLETYRAGSLWAARAIRTKELAAAADRARDAVPAGAG